MATFFLFLIWAVLGLVIGVLALAAHLVPSAWRTYGWLKLPTLGLGAALLGGLLGFWLFGRLFSSASALWIAVLAVCIPGCYESLRHRVARRV
ncbi:MAG TPA: hypothetical protein VGM01_06895 [Ktedonobacteraceae bacterium]|jgi:uncharacterized membrane protein